MIDIEKELLPFCECGCGGRVTKKGNRFIQHHQNRGRIMSDGQKVQIAKTLTKTKPEPQLCECGCGEYAKPGDRFIYQHHLRGINYAPKKLTKKKRKPKPEIPEPKLCGCGCGLYALPGNDYIAGHQNRGRQHSQEIKDRQSEIIKQFNKDHPEAGKIHSEFMKEYYNDPKNIEANRLRAIKQFSDQSARDEMSRIKSQYYSILYY